MFCPRQLPQRSSIPARKNNLPEGVNDYDIIASAMIPTANLLLMLTPTRVLIYNFKPLAIIAVHERSLDSFNDFGLNKGISTSNITVGDDGGLVSTDGVDTLPYHSGKILFYLSTESNYILAYNLIRDSSPETFFNDYALPVIQNDTKLVEEESQYDQVIDNDILVVFEKNKHSRVIQNGFGTRREIGFLQYLTSSPEMLYEMPVRRVELRLKVILKFDYKILDFMGFKSHKMDNVGILENGLFLLFPHGLQVLNLKDFKLSDYELLSIDDGIKLETFKDKLLIISQKSETNDLTLNEIYLKSKTVISKQFLSHKNFKDYFTIGNYIAVICPQKIELYDIFLLDLVLSWDTTIPIQFCKKFDENSIFAVLSNNSFYIYSIFGNVLFTTDEDGVEDDSYDRPAGVEEAKQSLMYSGFNYFDNTLIVTTNKGKYETWQMWNEFPGNMFDFRYSKSYIMANKNDFALVFPTDIRKGSVDMICTISLPTKTFNNYVTLVSIAGNSILTAIYISNKNILLMYNMVANIWFSFNHQHVLNMNWIGNNYLLCHLKRDDGGVYLACLKLPYDKIDADDINKYVIWIYDINDDDKFVKFVTNTLFKYKQIKIKNTVAVETATLFDKLHKTAEILLIYEDSLIIYDIISQIDVSGFNIIKKFHNYMHIKLPKGLSGKDIEWATSYHNGLLLFCNNKIVKLYGADGDEIKNPTIWKFDVLLENVERILDVFKDFIYVVQKNSTVMFTLKELWEGNEPMLSLPIEEFYPIIVSPESAIVHGLDVIYKNSAIESNNGTQTNATCKLNLKNRIFLDELISIELKKGIDKHDINSKYKTLNHYKFSLEKLLSHKILENENLDDIIELIKISRENEVDGIIRINETTMLEIISNCLRKIEIKNWESLFKSLKLSPRDLLDLCIENNEMKILGVLLLVFLNCNENDIIQDIDGDNKKSKNKNRNKNKSKRNAQNQSDVTSDKNSLSYVLRDEELMLQILKLLVTGAAKSTEINKAAEAWDMCFQLIQFLKELDKENKTNLVDKAMVVLKN
ncbi:hypothetical protein TPHA_0G02200 [Tetrapisispora phaffii CBS 4417]|uniref:RIC1 C-terminal alpha solenoid region domain-containing protein n=1 Tax=Tetrapisispora phaffii (strain ATCC 24235 / CBS 4417 / NBRC 1672 / NRRL Y-8282 / UCD 70-5) TaxID=1071381 RepID=G8BVX8_TETPH|nr:hypothetical protein TPHA_0G02200 [Tetrapisispora phaffii CBS 4417]CCE64056.1 hypothetical protein TPHA_0G02200 [Tetrapisispora phaffii CBS 4417]